MSIRFDEKGKFFTDIVSKETIPVIIQTLTNLIEGSFHIRPDERLKDEINNSDQFFAITEAIIQDLSGNELFRCDFFTINRDQIVWLLPKDQIVEKKDQGGES